MGYRFTIAQQQYDFPDLKSVMAKATPFRTGDALSGLAAESNKQRVAAQFVLSELPLKSFLEEPLIPYEEDEVTRLILDHHDEEAFAQISGFTIGDLRDWLLTDVADQKRLKQISKGLTPEMVAAVAKIMRNQDLIVVAKKCEVITRFRSTVGLKGRVSIRLQPNHPADDLKGILASVIDGLLYGSGDAVIGINPVTDSPDRVISQLELLENLRLKYEIPTQNCVLCHVTTTLDILEKAPVDLVFQSIAGT
ncbi:MAG: ethanolamine ammonia-lyase subunit EutB, partial [Bacteroidota bacterium]